MAALGPGFVIILALGFIIFLWAFARKLNRLTGELHSCQAKLQQVTQELNEALEQQTATSEILRVIASSPTDLQPVLDVVAENAAKLCDAVDGVIVRPEGDHLRILAKH
jgi:hypothetical protein